MLEYAGFGHLCAAAQFLGLDRLGRGAGGGDVPAPEIRTSGPDRALAPGHPAHGTGLDDLCGLGRMG